MEKLLTQVTEYKYIIAPVLVVLGLFWPKLMTIVKSIKIPSLPNLSSLKEKVVIEDQEIKDQNALRHLRDRAVLIGDKELLALIRNVDSRFFDIHIKDKGDKDV